jgi:uncharacterized membrane protein (UPF0182 family)
VIRGNLLTIPVGNSLFYVEPLYLQTGIRRPQLTQVIVAAGDKVAWADNSRGNPFEMAIAEVFSIGEKVEEPVQPGTGEGVATPREPRSLVDIISSARGNFSRYKTQMESGNADEAAQALEELDIDLSELERYKELLGRPQADILEDLIKGLLKTPDEGSDTEKSEPE